MLPERELCDRCARGDRRAWEELFRRYDRKILHALWNLAGPADFEDLTQEVWARLLRHDARALRSVRAEREGALGAFVAMVARSVALDHRRSRRARPELAQDEEATLKVADQAVSPEQFAHDTRLKEQLKRALEQVATESEHPGRDRDILRLHFEEGYSAAEIAGMGLGLPAKGVESVLRRSREKLSRLLAE